MIDERLKKHPKETGELTFSFVTDRIESAVRQSIAAAGPKNFTIIGIVKTVGEWIRAGLADELQIDIIPMFLKDGFRPFEDIIDTSINVKRKKVLELPEGRTHLRFQFIN